MIYTPPAYDPYPFDPQPAPRPIPRETRELISLGWGVLVIGLVFTGVVIAAGFLLAGIPWP